MPDSPPASGNKRKLRRKLVAVLGFLAIAGAVALKERHPLLALIGRGVAAITACGPWAYFGAMAILPGLGVPSTVFTLTAGTAFGPVIGMPAVVAAGVAAMSINMAYTYALARWVLRGHLQRLMARFGYKLPVVEKGDMNDLVIMLRVTTGVPLCVQNYLCGLADVPAGRYFLISYLLGWPNTAAYLWFGDALLHGRGKMILLALTAIVILTVATHFLRRHYAGRKAAAA